MLVASGVGLMFSPENAGRMLAVTDLQWRPITDLGLEVSEIVMWRPDDADTSLLRPFLEIVRELRAELYAPSKGQAPGTGQRRQRSRRRA